MKKKKPPKEVHQPDDKIFKYLMKKEEGAREYLRTIVPEWAEILDLDKIAYVDESFMIPGLKAFDADSVHRCSFKNSDKKLNICFLWENKLQPEKHVAIQMGLYMFLAYYKMVKNPKRKLEPILPLLFYNGEKDRTPLTVKKLFAEHPYFKFIQPFLPDFALHFTNVQKISNEQLMAVQFDFFKSVMIAMTNRHDWDLLLQKISVIFAIDEEDNQVAIGHYIFGIFERLPEEVKKDIQHLKFDTKSNIMTTLEMLREEGRVEGKIKGKIEGKIEGKEIGATLTNIKVILRGISKLPDLPIHVVALLTEQPEALVAKIKSGFMEGDETKARKLLIGLFKNVKDLEKEDKAQIEQVIKEFLPKFRSK